MSVNQGMYRIINPFHATDFFLYPLKTLENHMLSGGIDR